VKGLVVDPRPKADEQFEKVGVASDRLRPFKGHDKDVRRKDGVLHDRADLVRAVDDDKFKWRHSLLGKQPCQKRLVVFGIGNSPANVFKTNGARNEHQPINPRWVDNVPERRVRGHRRDQRAGVRQAVTRVEPLGITTYWLWITPNTNEPGSALS